ncbi:hypothetical protein ASAC_1121 [Acidilobus saccharovorans 345-15]|uniref:Uncharacterized protein n=2 Tax=Acidilobus TaxID=105850 RepID=D9Q2I8_ACIS3|nr:hypothetical protein ASAC_1121 [Acidilobus saccharovorans 345-15]
MLGGYMERPKVKIDDKEIELTDEVIKLLRKYVKTNMTLEQLASELSLNGWEEAYELVKNVPSWLLRNYTG